MPAAQTMGNMDGRRHAGRRRCGVEQLKCAHVKLIGEINATLNAPALLHD